MHLQRLLPAEDWACLHPAIARRFARHDAPILYRGVLSIQRSWLGALSAWCAAPFGQPLPLHGAKDVPAEVRVFPDGHGGVVWERWLLAPGRQAACVRSTKRLGPTGLEECTDAGLGMALTLRAEHGALVFQSQSYFLACGRWRMKLPGWATPGTCRVTHTDLGDGLFRFTMEMRHRVWGLTVSQRGVFVDPEVIWNAENSASISAKVSSPVQA